MGCACTIANHFPFLLLRVNKMHTDFKLPSEYSKIRRPTAYELSGCVLVKGTVEWRANSNVSQQKSPNSLYPFWRWRPEHSAADRVECTPTNVCKHGQADLVNLHHLGWWLITDESVVVLLVSCYSVTVYPSFASTVPELPQPSYVEFDQCTENTDQKRWRGNHILNQVVEERRALLLNLCVR